MPNNKCVNCEIKRSEMDRYRTVTQTVTVNEKQIEMNKEIDWCQMCNKMVNEQKLNKALFEDEIGLYDSTVKNHVVSTKYNRYEEYGVKYYNPYAKAERRIYEYGGRIKTDTPEEINTYRFNNLIESYRKVADRLSDLINAKVSMSYSWLQIDHIRYSLSDIYDGERINKDHIYEMAWQLENRIIKLERTLARLKRERDERNVADFYNDIAKMDFTIDLKNAVKKTFDIKNELDNLLDGLI